MEEILEEELSKNTSLGFSETNPRSLLIIYRLYRANPLATEARTFENAVLRYVLPFSSFILHPLSFAVSGAGNGLCPPAE